MESSLHNDRMGKRRGSLLSPWKVLVLLGLFQAVFTLPFLNQAFHMDDPIYLDIGRNALSHPWEPHDFPYGFTGYAVKDMASHSHPPFTGYYIAIWMKITGNIRPPAWLMHLAFVPFSLLLAWAMYFLSRRFSSSPLLSTILAISSPTVVVLSHTLMSDFPTLAFWTAGIALFIYGSDREDRRLLLGAALCLCLAAFASYPALLAALLCGLYLRLNPSGSRLARWIPWIPFLFMAVWLAKSSLHYGRFLLAATARYALQETQSLGGALWEKGVTFPVLLAGVLLFSLPVIFRVLLIWKGRLAILLGMISVCVVQTGPATYRLPEKLLFLSLFWTGLLTLTGLALLAWRSLPAGRDFPGTDHAREGGRMGWGTGLRIAAWFSSLGPAEKDRLFLSAWFWTVAVIAILIYTSASPRYLLPLVPPLAILTMEIVSLSGERCDRRLALAGAILSSVLAITFSMADYQTADVYRQMGQDTKTIFRGWEDRVRFGGEWGFRHAMEENGFRQFLSVSDDFKGGDFLLIPQQATPYTLPQDVESMSVDLGFREYLSGFPIQLMCREAHAGFYSSGWGWLPFGFYRGPVERFQIRQVSPVVETLPEAAVRCSSGKPVLVLPSLHGPGIDLRLEGNCRLSFPLPKGPVSRISVEAVSSDSSGKAFPEIDFLHLSGREERGDVLAVKKEDCCRYLVELPSTETGDRLEIRLDWPGELDVKVIRLHDLIRLPDSFALGGERHGL